MNGDNRADRERHMTRADDLRPLLAAVGQVLRQMAWLVEHRVADETDPAWTDEDREALRSFAETNTAAIKYLDTKIDQLQQAEAAIAAAVRSRPPDERLN